MARWFALALALALGLPGFSSGPAQADAGSDQVVVATVYSSSGTSTASATLAGLQNCPAYTGPSTMQELGLQGFVPVTFPSNAWALSTVLSCLAPKPVTLGGQGGVTVLDINGSPETGPGSELTAADLAPPGQTDFNNSQEGAVVSDLGTAIRYDRPWRGPAQGQADYDFLDQVTDSDNDSPQPVGIEVFEGPLLTVTVHASQTSVPAGGTVSFSAAVTGQNDSGLSYSWGFDGAAPGSSAAAPQLTFANAGEYNVTVQVTDAAGGGGVASVSITVGTPPAPAAGGHNQTGAGTNRKSQTPTGPKKSGGHHAGGPAGKPKSTQSTTAGKGNGANAGTGKASPGTSSTHASTTPSSTPTGASSHPATTSASPHRATTSPERAKRAPVPPAQPTTPVPLAGPRVTGLLVSDVTPVAADASPLVHTVAAPLATAPPARQAIRTSPLPVLGAGLALVLLLGLGAGRELRTRRNWRALRFGS